MAGIARVTGVSRKWLQDYVNAKYKGVYREINLSKKRGKLTIQADEMWSFVEKKKPQQWLGLAVDRNTKEKERSKKEISTKPRLKLHQKSSQS